MTTIVFRGSKPKLLCSERIKSAHRNHGRSDQHGTDRNLHDQQHVADGHPPPKPARRLDPALTISYGLARSTWRTGTMPKRNPLTKAKTKATT